MDEFKKKFSAVLELWQRSANENPDGKQDDKVQRTQRNVLIEDTTECVELLLQIHKEASDTAIVRFRQSKDVYPLTLTVGKHVCEIVCKLCKQTARSYSPEGLDYVASVFEIPDLFDQVMAYLTPEQPNDLSDTANIEGVSVEEIKQCRRTLHTSCVDFCTFVCKQMKSVLKVMKISIFRSQNGFEQLLICVVKQYLYIQRAFGLARDLLECTPREEQQFHIRAYRIVFKRIRRLLSHGLFVLHTLSFVEPGIPDVEVACRKIKECRSNLKDYLKSENDQENVINLLIEIQSVSFDICETCKLDQIISCLPAGEEEIGEDVTAIHSYDSHKDPDIDSDDENGSDFEEVDNVNESDFVGSLTKISLENSEDLFKGSDIERTELIQSYKMEGFSTPVEVCVDNHGQFTCPSVSGKVRRNSKWIPAKNVRVEGNKVKMTIDPGEYFAVHYTFPSGQQTFKDDEVKKGVTMPIPETDCSLKLSPSAAGEVTITYKVHLLDERRIKGYQEENPEEFDSIDIQPGIQTSVSGNIKMGTLELRKQNQREDAAYVLMTTDRGFKHWDRKELKPVLQRASLLVEFPLRPNSISFIVKDTKYRDKSGNLNQENRKSQTNPRSFLDRVTDSVLTLLGFKSRCKLLTFYRVPDEDDEEIVDLRIYCIESKSNALNNTANGVIKNRWMQIEDGDESSDFVIRSGDEILFDFSSNLKPIEELPCPTLTFIQKGRSFVQTQLQFLEGSNMKGLVLMYHKEKLIDWKKLTWQYLRENYEGFEASDHETSTEERRTLWDKKKKERMKFNVRLQREPERILNNILSQINDDQKVNLKRKLNMVSQKDDERFLERLVVHIKEQDEPVKYMVQLLKHIDREDLCYELLN